MNEKLWKIDRRLDTDYEPYGKAERDGSDCSCGCRHFVKLTNEIGDDWGVCSNPESPRSELLTFAHQGCTAFEPMTVDRNLTDAQLRHLFAEASRILQDRRRDLTDTAAVENPPLSLEGGDFAYSVKTSYFPLIKDHFPTIFHFEWHEDDWVALPLESRVGGDERPAVIVRCNAKNGDVFRVVRMNGEFSYQVPLNGRLYNLKQRCDLSAIGIAQMESLRRFLEHVEPETFDKIVNGTHSGLKWATRWLEESLARLERWRRKEFWGNESAWTNQDLREMQAQEERTVRETPTHITQCEVLLEWLKGVDRSNPRLKAVACPPAPERRSGRW
jgi:hypothetical protein